MSRKSTMSPESAAVINHLKDNCRCSVDQLCAGFPDVPRTVLLKRLNNLRALGWLEVSRNDDGIGVWFVRSSARATAVHTTEPAFSEPVQVQARPVAEPRRVNVMSGTYVPPRGPALRPGALDFLARPSVGYRC
jgi:hypothetical protein